MWPTVRSTRLRLSLRNAVRQRQVKSDRPASLARPLWRPPTGGLPAGLAITGGTAFLLRLITSRISGHYLPVATIAWCASFFYLFGVLPGLGGFNGFGEIPPLFPGITRGIAAASIGVVLIVAYLLCANLLSSRTGRAMRALAQSRIMAESLGIDTARLARATFVLAALLAGVAGWLFAHIRRYVSPAPFGLSASIEYVFLVVIGGASQLAGAVIGAAIVVLLRDQLTELLPRLLGSSGNFETVAFGIAAILLLHYAPRGIAPALFPGGARPPGIAALWLCQPGPCRLTARWCWKPPRWKSASAAWLRRVRSSYQCMRERSSG